MQDITYKARLLFIAGALLVSCVAAPVQAQTANETAQLLNQINQLQTQIQTLSRAVYRGDKNAVAALAESGNSAAAANYEERMSQIEDQQRKLTGQLEKVSYDLQQVQDRLTRMQVDNDQRFLQLGQGSGAAPVESAPGQGTSGGTLGTLQSNNGVGNGPAETLYEQAFANIRSAEYDDAETQFKQFLQQYPGHPLSANAQYWLGETHYVRGDYKKAAKSFAQGYQDFPKSAKAADSLLKLGLSLSKMGKKDDACLSLRQLQQEFASGAGPQLLKAQQEIKQLGCP